MRASFWVIGPLVARMGEARVSLPGGCAIGTRPVDFFLNGLRQLGAEIDIDNGYVVARAPKGGLDGGLVHLPTVSVGATHTIMMAATLARGTTVIENAAMEPEIDNVARCLVAMGARVEGIGTRTIAIEGVPALHGARVEVIPDRIEAGTFAIATAMTGGNVLLKDARWEHLESALDVLGRAGAQLTREDGGIRIQRNGNGIQPVDVEVDTFPGFATDLQAQFMALMTRAQGISLIAETIFENRFMHVPELMRMGANVRLDGRRAIVAGPSALSGAGVLASDLRASASLVLAALVASGETTIDRVYHIDRGYEKIEEKLARAGADIRRVK